MERIIAQLPKNAQVLDVGAGGLKGINTTNALLAHFDRVVGINTDFSGFEHDKLEKIATDFYQMEPTGKFDLIVKDLDAKNNVVRDWTEEELARVRNMLNDGGYLIQYLFLTNQYEGIEELIQKNWIEFWETENLQLQDVGERLGRLTGWEAFAFEREERRPYILWLMLKKI